MPENSQSEVAGVKQPTVLRKVLRFFGGVMIGFLASSVALSATGVVLIILLQVSSGPSLQIDAEAIGWGVFLAMVVVIAVGFVKIMGSFNDARAMICGMAAGVLTIFFTLNEMAF